jgi:carbon starvation protein
MTLSILALAVLAALATGYVLYGSYIARQFRLDDTRRTPAVERNDGVDFVPERPFYLMSQHFSAIAAAGPIVGPIAACMAFGWLPCLLWVGLGVIFIGAVHDFAALVASIRHGASSIAEVARQNIGTRGYLALVAFIWLALVYVIVAFTDVTAAGFLGADPELQAIQADFHRGGAVAMASTLYLGLALVLGLVQWRLRPPLWLVTVVFVPATLGMVWLGTQWSGVLLFDARTWYLAILAYCFVASMLPLWLLQQSRGYLGGFVLYLSLTLGVVGLLFGGFEIQQPMIKNVDRNLLGWFGAGTEQDMGVLLFPFLFVTIACGACSGFHGLVCGGSTSRQVSKESHCKPIAFGSMLLEGFVAVIALATIMIVAPSANDTRAPGVIYGEGLARFLTTLFGDQHLVYAKTFGTMVIATFVFDTLDVSTRLGRYLLQELTGLKDRVSGLIAAAVTAGVPLVILMAAEPGSWRKFWTLFGTSNQLLAALTLLGITVWLARNGRRYLYVAVPMVFVMVITMTALVVQITGAARTIAAKGLRPDATTFNAAASVALLVLAVVFVIEALRAGRRPMEGAARFVLSGSELSAQRRNRPPAGL